MQRTCSWFLGLGIELLQEITDDQTGAIEELTAIVHL